MNALRLWARERRAEGRIAGRRAEVLAALEAHLGRRCTLARAGSRGQDSVYRVRDSGGGDLAVLRLVNPHLKRGRVAPGMPFRDLGGAGRVEREWSCYERGAPHGLTPRPLWRADDALAAEFVPGRRLARRVRARPTLLGEALDVAVEALARLHAVGLTHLDASLDNLVATPDGGLVFVDFEYGPAPGLTPAQERALDHLRLLETSGALASGRAAARERWLAAFDRCTAEGRRCDLTTLEPALPRLFADGPLAEAVRRRFSS